METSQPCLRAWPVTLLTMKLPLHYVKMKREKDWDPNAPLRVVLQWLIQELHPHTDQSQRTLGPGALSPPCPHGVLGNSPGLIPSPAVRQLRDPEQALTLPVHCGVLVYQAGGWL